MKPPIIASYVLLFFFILFSFITWNTEFIIYSGVIIPLVLLLHKGDSVFTFRTWALWGFDVWLLLHLLGGMATWHGIRFYDYILVPIVGEPYLILKYDQVVHFYCFMVFAVLLGSIIAKAVKKDASPWIFGAIIVFTTMGVGALNEVIEFMPVVFLNSPGPGGYVNTALDLCANALGAIAGAWLYVKK